MPTTLDPEQEKDKTDELEDLYRKPSSKESGSSKLAQRDKQLEEAYRMPAADKTYDRPGNAPSETPGRRHKKKSDLNKEENQAGESPDGGSDEEREELVTRTRHENQVGRGYLGRGKQKVKNSWDSWRSRRMLAFAGIMGALFIAAIVAFFGFESVFKLDHIMSNIDARTFARLNGVEDTRSYRWMQAYMEMRMADIGDKPNLDKGTGSDNAFFRAEKVGVPVLDWYRNMRNSKFEQDVFEKHGFKFVSVAYRDANGNLRVRPGKIILNGNTVDVVNMSNSDFNNLMKGDTATIRKFNDLVDVEKFDTHGEARKAIKKAVNDEIAFYRVFKRRHIRKDIQEMAGVRSWRFFDNSRQKVQEKKIDIRNKIIASAVPEDTKTGRFINCLFGISDCKFSGDTSNPVNQSGGSLEGAAHPNDPVEETTTDANGNKTTTVENVPQTSEGTVKGSGILSPEESAKLLSGVISKAATALNYLNIMSMLNSFSNINKAMKSHQLSKGVAIARGVQAMGLYQIFETARDQMKTGQVNGGEVNDFMNAISTSTSSSAWDKVVVGKGDPSTPDSSAAAVKYCKPENQVRLEKDPSLATTKEEFSYAYDCPDKKIGGKNNAQIIENGYNASIGKIISPFLAVYDKIHSGIFGRLIDAVNGIVGKISDAIVKSVIAVLGLGNEMDKVTRWLAGKMASFLGAGILSPPSDPPGQLLSWVIQGASFTAESSMRQNGASLTTPESAAAAQVAMAQYQSDQQSRLSLFDRYLSPSNPSSPAANTAFAISQFRFAAIGDAFSSFGSILKNAFSAVMMPFSRHALASSNDGYAGADFAGIQTYDMPTACLNMDPLQETPLNATNFREIMSKYGATIPDTDLTWPIVTSNQSWYQYIYSKINSLPDVKDGKVDADTIAEQVYNCNLMDASVRDSLGYLYGYTNDSGLDDSTSAPADSTTTITNNAGVTIDTASLYQDSTGVGCAEGTKDLGVQNGYHDGSQIPIRICAIPGFHQTNDSLSRFGVSGSGGNIVVNSRVSGAVLALFKAAKQSGLTLQANSSFRTMSYQQSLCPCDGVNVARPGYSNHQMGLAIDFYGLPSTPGPIPGNPVWDWLANNAINFGYKNYPHEAWHWSPTGN